MICCVSTSRLVQKNEPVLCVQKLQHMSAATTRVSLQIYLVPAIMSSFCFMFASFAATRLPAHAKSSPSALAHSSKPGRAKRHDCARPSRLLAWPQAREGGARLADRLGIATSPTTVLRCVMALPLPPVEPVSHLGIDDFALRRGRTYGTVLVDLSRHKAIDLLPDRKAETAKAWMLTHAEIELVSRDRGGDYATAASQGAPQAIQTADRFHLCKNLTEAVEKALARCRAEIRKSQKARKKPIEDAGPREPASALSTSDGKPYSAHQTERYDRYQQVIAFREQGAKVKDIAKRVGLGRRTVQRWLSEGTYIETNYHHRHRSRFDSYEAYVRKRWDEGCHNIQHIWREVKAQGYPHSDRALRRHLEAVRGKKPDELEEAGVLDHFSAKKAVWLFVRPFSDLSKKEQEELQAMRQVVNTSNIWTGYSWLSSDSA
jgi:transposase